MSSVCSWVARSLPAALTTSCSISHQSFRSAGGGGLSFISINKDHEMNNIKYILVNDGAAEPRSKAALPRFSDLKVQSDPRVDDNGPLAQFKVQGSKFKVQGGFAAVQWASPSSKFKVQGGFAAVQRASPSSKIKGQRSKFSDLKVQSDQRSMTKIKVQSGFAAGQSGSEREGLIEELCRLRKQYPKAKILGVSELGEHCVHPSERMNQLRRELSERL